MAARQEVTFVISARNRARAVFRGIRRNISNLLTSTRSLVGLLGAAFSVTRLAQFSKQLESASSVLGISIQRLDALRIQAQGANIPFETLIDVLRQTATNAANAAKEGGPLLEAFRDIGFDSPAELRAANLEEILLRMANAAQEAFDSGRINEFRGTLRRVAGETGVNLLALFDRRGPRQIFEESQRLINEGVARSAESVRTLAEAERDATEKLNEATAALSAVMSELAPLIAELAETIQQAIEFYKQFDAEQAKQIAEDTGELIRNRTVGNVESIGAELESLNLRRAAAERAGDRVQQQQLETLIAIREGLNPFEPGVFGQ